MPSRLAILRDASVLRTKAPQDEVRKAGLPRGLLHQMECPVPHRHHELAARVVTGMLSRRVGQEPVIEIEALNVFERITNSVFEFLRTGLAALQPLRDRDLQQ